MQTPRAGEDPDDFDDILLPLERAVGAALNEPRRSTCRAAFQLHPAGFRAAVDDVLSRPNVRNRIGLLITKCLADDIALADRAAAAREARDTAWAVYDFPDGDDPESRYDGWRLTCILEDPEEVVRVEFTTEDDCKKRLAELKATGRVFQSAVVPKVRRTW